MIIIYYKKNNKLPVKEFIDGLEVKDELKVNGCLENIRQLGFKAPRVEFKFIDKKLWEIKIITSSGGVRIFYVIIEINKMVLLHAYKKKTQKIPKKELEIATKRMNEILNKFKD